MPSAVEAGCRTLHPGLSATLAILPTLHSGHYRPLATRCPGPAVTAPLPSPSHGLSAASEAGPVLHSTLACTLHTVYTALCTVNCALY